MTKQLGWYDEAEREYVVNLSAGEWTPRPWSNIITNKNFGTLITCSGASFTWFLNSGLFRLTPWVNDLVTENAGEQIFLSEETTGETWSPVPLPLRDESPYEIRHGLGYTTFTHNSHQILQKVKIFVHAEKPLKCVEINLLNLAKVPRKISLNYSCQWVLGDFLDNTKKFLWTGVSANKEAFLAKVLVPDFRSEYTAFLTCSNDKKVVTLLPGQEVLTVFFLGVAKDANLEKEIESVRKGHDNKIFVQGQDFWQNITKTISVDCPDADLNILFNDRLIYQALACRLWAKTGMYQPGGAFGFRDQLQDSLSLVWSRPDITREQILLAASQQFSSGEVQQWWHPPENFGSLSVASDSHLWLVYVTCKYCQITGDKTILKEKIPYLNDKDKKEGTLYEHCLLSIERTLSQIGSHGLPLILSGDWNDSLDNIGKNHQGESVWLSLFLSYVLENFSKIGEKDFTPIAKYQAELVEKLAWNNEWFIRAFADDGRKIEFIDSIVQSWAIICGLINKDLAQTAMDAVLNKLVDKENNLVRLLTPAISNSNTPFLGYIQQYPPGVRENGGFYCHAAVWVVWALALLGKGNSAMEIINMLNPLKRNQKYLVEPYVLASDILASKPREGQGGWSWYTGSAATLYYVLLEEIFGLKLRGNKLIIDPCLPNNWNKLTIKFKNYQIKISNPKKINRGVKEVFLDGVKQPDNEIAFIADANTHLVLVNMG